MADNPFQLDPNGDLLGAMKPPSDGAGRMMAYRHQMPAFVPAEASAQDAGRFAQPRIDPAYPLYEGLPPSDPNAQPINWSTPEIKDQATARQPLSYDQLPPDTTGILEAIVNMQRMDGKYDPTRAPYVPGARQSTNVEWRVPPR